MLNLRLGAFFLTMLVWGWAFGPALFEMYDTWLDSNTYTHGFLIAPISLFLIWEKKIELSNVASKLFWPAMVLLLGIQLFQLMAVLAGVYLFQQIAAYLSLVCIVWWLWGSAKIQVIVFPMFFLIFCIPMGEELVPWLQQITADLSVWMLQLSSVPIYREGLYLFVPNGAFEVAEACAGIRFLIASVALGTLFCYMFYTSPVKRVLFFVVALTLPILANGIRAYGIMMIGYHTDMEHATGADHLVYGWGFFAFVIFLLFAIGNMFRDPMKPAPEENTLSVTNVGLNVQSRNMLLLSVLAISTVLMSPGTYLHLVKQSNHAKPADWTSLSAQLENEIAANWGVNFKNSSEIISGKFNTPTADFDVYAAYYFEDSQDQELITWANRFFDVDEWSIVNSSVETLDIDEVKIEYKNLQLTNLFGKQRWLVAWYQVGDTFSQDPLTIKLYQLLDKLAGGSGEGVFVAVSALEPVSKEDVLQFITQHAALLQLPE
ncbi:MAG: exosortase A [Paraglaciecola sp.]|jgi:exosortase A